LATYESYPYNIQRSDALRYFLLFHYGGIYLDLDIAPYRPLDILLSYPAWACRTLPTGISNDALGSIPHHPFFRQVINSLETYNKNWFLPYVTVMYTTGPLFLSVMWKDYVAGEHTPGERFNVVMIDEENFGNTYGFFNNTDGGSWHQGDVVIISWMGNHWETVTSAGFIVGFGITALFWCVFKSVADRGGYKFLARELRHCF
jgi:inositol phosphorylceramide mannosyltransferase catalytic subunit